MSQTDIEPPEAEDELRKERCAVRSVAVEKLSLASDGRTVDAKIVPFREPAQVTQLGRDGKPETFMEMFAPDSLTAVCQLAEQRGDFAWISMNLDHEDVLDKRIGYAKSVEQREDGGYATFRLYKRSDLEMIQDMLSTSHRGMSIMFHDRAKPRRVGGIIERVQVMLHHVAATPIPVYKNTGVVAMRNGEETPELGTPALDEVQAWLAAQSA